jgi:hypothetical protein
VVGWWLPAQRTVTSSRLYLCRHSQQPFLTRHTTENTKPNQKPQKTTNQQELAKNIDIDGDGEIEPEEKEILDTLRSMDVDGDGTISLRELVNLGAKLNEQRDTAAFYKKVVYGVLLIALLSILAVFLACFAAVEASKDTRPGADGVMKTVVTAGSDAKVVATAAYEESVALTALHGAAFSTLRGIKDLGFKVGNRNYQYTVTGFEQDIAADGSASVRLFTSRGDSIFVSKAVANLERAATGTFIDISAAAVQNRKLLAKLSADHRRSLLAAHTTDYQHDTATFMYGITAHDQDAAEATYVNTTTAAYAAATAFAPKCPPKFQLNQTDNGTDDCRCRSGHKGSAAHNGSHWNVVQPCEFVQPPENVTYKCDLARGECWDIKCAFTGDNVTFDQDSGEWQNSDKTMFIDGQCELPYMPMDMDEESFELEPHVITEWGVTRREYEYRSQCAVGYASKSETGPRYDMSMYMWTQPCNPVYPNDPMAYRVYDNKGNYKNHTMCYTESGVHSLAPYFWFPGFPWDNQTGWVSIDDFRQKLKAYNAKNPGDPVPVSEFSLPADLTLKSGCRDNKMGYNYTCGDDGYCVEVVANTPVGVVATKEPMVATCAPGYGGSVEWTTTPTMTITTPPTATTPMKTTTETTDHWNSSCVEIKPRCPDDSIQSGADCVCDYKTHEGPGYEYDRSVGVMPGVGVQANTSVLYVLGEYKKIDDKGVSGCQRRPCPPKTMYKETTTAGVKIGECVCKVTQMPITYDAATFTWDTSTCPATQSCPTGAQWNPVDNKCVCPDNSAGNVYKRKPALATCDASSATWAAFNTCVTPAMQATAATEQQAWTGSCTVYKNPFPYPIVPVPNVTNVTAA